MSTLRVLKNHSSLLSHTFYVDGDPTDPSPDTATVTITRADGTAIVTGAAAGNAGVGVFTYTLDSQTALDRLTVDWTASFSGQSHVERDYVEIVGGFYVTIAEIQALNSMQSATDAQVVAARQWFEDKVERLLGAAFVPRFARETFDGDGSARLYLGKRPVRRPLLSVTIDGTLATDDFAVKPRGRVTRVTGTTHTAFPAGYENVLIAYEHGFDAPTADLKEAALAAIRFKILGDRSGIPDRAVTVSTDTGIGYTMSIAGIDRPFGLPEVDAALQGLYEPVVA